MPSFIGLRKTLQMPPYDQPIFTAHFGILVPMCFEAVSLPLYHPLDFRLPGSKIVNPLEQDSTTIVSLPPCLEHVPLEGRRRYSLCKVW